MKKLFLFLLLSLGLTTISYGMTGLMMLYVCGLNRNQLTRAI